MQPLVTYFYRAYGVTLASNTRVPGLPSEHMLFDQPDIVLNLGLQPDWVRDATHLPNVGHPRPQSADKGESGFLLTSFGAGKFFQLTYADGTRFVVDSPAQRLWGECPPPLTIEDLATYLSGPVMGFILRRRGVLPLHASAVCIAAQAVVLCGESAAGKSTTAAALARTGVPVLTEDISPIQEENGALFVEPGYPRVCLWPDTVEKLFGAPEALPLLTPTWEKRFLALDGVTAKFEPQRQPLGAIYLLAPRAEEPDAPRIEELDKREALLELVQNTCMNWLLDRTQRAAELDVLSKIVARVPVRRIVPHSDPERVGALCDRILADAEHVLAGRDSAALLPTR
jgi:hypothetical protein